MSHSKRTLFTVSVTMDGGTLDSKVRGISLTGHSGGKTPDASAGFNALVFAKQSRCCSPEADVDIRGAVHLDARVVQVAKRVHDTMSAGALSTTFVFYPFI